MADGMKDSCENKTQVKDVEIEKLQTIEAEEDAYDAIVIQDEHNKEIKREKNKKRLKH